MISRPYQNISNIKRMQIRYRLSLFLTFCLIPEMISVNLWGSLKFKSSQFTNVTRSSDEDPHDPDVLCKLNTYYQLLGIVYMLMIYCEVITFFVIACVFCSNMKRFYHITDEVSPADQQRLPRREGGRIHPLLNRSHIESLSAFEYSYSMMTSCRITRSSEIQLILDLKVRIQGRTLKQTCMQVVTYVMQDSTDELGTHFLNPMDANTINQSSVGDLTKVEIETENQAGKEESKEQPSSKADQRRSSKEELNALFKKFGECTICLNKFENNQKVVVLGNCKHIFHQRCCDEWLDYKFRCPNCNLEILPPNQQRYEPEEADAHNLSVHSEESLRNSIRERRDTLDSQNQNLLFADPLLHQVHEERERQRDHERMAMYGYIGMHI